MVKSKLLRKMLSMFLVLIMVVSTLYTAFAATPASTPITGSGSTYYVDGTNGNDATGDGSSENPWKTISKAAGVMTAGDTCKIRKGVYRETVKPANSGAEGEGNAITFEPDTGADVTISGADMITGSWAQDTGSIYKTSATLSMGNLFLDSVYVDGVRMNLARYPNAPVGDTVNELFDPEFTTYLKADDGSKDSPYFNGYATLVSAALTEPAGYWDGAQVMTTDSYGWCLSGATVTSSEPGVLHLGRGNAFSVGPNSHYYLVGKKATLDNPGEWFYDSAEHSLYLQAPASDDPSGHVVEAKARELGFDLTNKSYINVKGIKFFSSTIDTTGGSNCVLDGINAKYLSDFYEPYKNVGGLILGGTNQTLKNSTLRYSSGAVLNVEGENNRVFNNLMEYGTYGPTLSLTMVFVEGKGQLISNNTMRYAAREILGGNYFASDIQYNDLGYGNYQGQDTGIMYQAHSDYGNSEVHNNYIHDSIQAYSCGFYSDLGVRNLTVYKNVIWNIPGTALYSMFNNDSSDFVSYINNTCYNVSEIRSHSSRDAYRDVYANNISLDGMDRTDEPSGAIFSYNMLTGDPKYVNVDPLAGAYDFHLQEGSAAIDPVDAVVIPGITDGYAGAAPDYGAYEYGGIDWTAGCELQNPPADPVLSLYDFEFKNFVVNGGFEWDRLALSNYPNSYGWTFSNASVVQDPGDLSRARLSYKYGCELGSGAASIEQTITGLKPNTAYEVRAFGRIAATGTIETLGVKDFGGTDQSVDINSKLTFKDAKLTFTTGADNTTAILYASKAAGGLAYIDDIMLSLAASPIPIAPAAPKEETKYPPFDAPVAIIDDMLQDGVNWQASDAEKLHINDYSVTVPANIIAGYYGQKYLDKEIYLNLNLDEASAAGAASDDTLAGIVLRAADPKASVSSGNNAYQIVISKADIKIQGWKDSAMSFEQSFANTTIQPGTTALLKVSAVNEYEGTGDAKTITGVRIKVKVGDTVAAEYLDTTKLIPDEGYFGITASKPLTISRITNPVNIDQLLEDKNNWQASNSGTLNFEGDSLNVSGNLTTAGYFGKKINKNSEYTLRFRTDTSLSGCWPSIMLRSENPLRAPYEGGNDAYQIVFKKDTFEIQGWTGANQRVNQIFSQAVYSPDEDAVIKVSTVNTDAGVWIRLKIDNKIVANFVDPGNTVDTAGYFGLIAWTPVTISKVPAMNVDEMLDHTADWQTGENSEFTGNSLIMTGSDTAQYLGEKYKDDEIALKLKGTSAGIRLRSNEAGDSYYNINFTDSNVDIEGFVNGQQQFSKSTSNEVIKPDNYAWVKVSAVDTDTGVRIRVKVNDTVVAEYVDTARLLPDAGYFGFETSDSAMISRVVYSTRVNSLIDDPDNWITDTNNSLEFNGNSLTIGGGQVSAGYTARAFKNEEFEMMFNTDTATPGNWPSILLRSSDPTKDVWAGNNCYGIVFKKDIFEIQGWRNSGNPIFKTYPNTVLKSEMDTLIKVSAIDTPAGVRIRLKVNNETVIDYLDTTNLNPEPGYFAVVAWNPIKLSKVTPVFNQESGSAVSLDTGDYTGAQLAAAGISGTVSSIKVPAGFKVEVYSEDNFAGTSTVFAEDTTTVTGNVGSMKITLSQPEPVPGPDEETPPDPTPNINLALGKTVETSSFYSDEWGAYLPGVNAVDGDAGTRWAAAAFNTDPQWISVDLGETKTINDLKLNWETRPSSYVIQVSDDGSTWTDVNTTISASEAVDDVTFTALDTQFVRMMAAPRGALDYGVSLYEFEIYSPDETTPPPSNVNLALNKPVAESSHYSDEWGTDLPASNAVDGDATTRWSSFAYNIDPQWISVDLGQTYTIDNVVLNWTVHNSAYEVQVSTDNQDWTTVYTADNGAPEAIADIKFTATDARYVRIFVAARPSDWGVSLNEFEVYAQTETTPPPEVNIALGKTIDVSSHYSDEWGTNLPGINAVDGDAATRWAAAAFTGNPEWISVDLGETKTIGHVILNWGSANPTPYKVQVSADGANWTDVYSADSGAGAVDDITFTATDTRYVRVYSSPRSSGEYGISLNEFEVYGQTGTTPPPVVNLALNKTVSGNEEAATAALTVDGNTETRWNSLPDFTGDRWISVDLGSVQGINEVVVKWFRGAYSSNFKVQVSNDGTNWTEAATGTNPGSYMNEQASSPVNDITFDTASARYVRLYMGNENQISWYGFSITELEVYGSSVPIPVTHTITAGTGEHGTISPNGAQDVEDGTDITFTFAPDSGYEVDQLMIDGLVVTVSGNSYTFTDVTGDHTISVTFKASIPPVFHTITANAGKYGSISSNGEVDVEEGTSITFTFLPENGYEVDKLRIDGLKITVDGNSYTFTNVTGDHTISVDFKKVKKDK